MKYKLEQPVKIAYGGHTHVTGQFRNDLSSNLYNIRIRINLATVKFRS